MAADDYDTTDAAHPMSDDQADLLRRAADHLDVLASDAVLTPWRIVPHAEYDQMPYIVGFGRETALEVTVARDVVNANYITAMHPGVGKTLATWLRLVGRLLSEGFDPNAETHAALAVADAILGGSADA